ncbi:hypothetical protein [Leptolyngbya sp. Cla-17]|uniref:hypothetical protein n=1 Tax=Leptolyngbya sp. Cla-17 TaxID=2803751 RepID=UPI001F5C963D|nr:hypothetical protein [Leptolyngbya sp. Cla-17]
MEEPANIPTVEDLLSRLDSPPEPYTPAPTAERSEPLRRVRPAINYLEREARNAALAGLVKNLCLILSEHGSSDWGKKALHTE